MVAGLNWAGDPCGVKDSGGNGGSCAWLSYEPTDGLHQLVVSFHTYNWTSCNSVDCWNDSVAPVATQVPVVTGEFGERDCSTTYSSQFMAWADQHDISYLAWSWQPSNAATHGCTASNLGLLSTWKGPAASPSSQVGPAVETHLAQLSTG
jgi:hypothetical protein